MCMNEKHRHSGFTIVELLVVVAITGILLAIGIPSLNNSREKSRDTARISDINQLEFALEVYYEANGQYPQGVDGVVGEGGAIDAILEPFMIVVPSDPIGSAGDNTYEYVYDTSSDCADALVYAKTMERDSLNANANELCPDTIGDEPHYIIRLGNVYS